MAGDAAAAGPSLLSSVGHIVTLPVTVARAIADDIVTTAQRPDAVLYWGGLAGLAALGVIDPPVAAAVGVGIAIASGRRRTGARQPAA
jgi:hypothetical protein